MDYLLDTNIPSEVRRPQGSPKVKAWFAGVPASSLHVSVVTIAEIRKGVVRKRLVDPVAALSLERWLAGLLANFGARILTLDRQAAERWGDIMGRHAGVPVEDGIQAAIAMRHGMTLVTHNVRHIAAVHGLVYLDPW